MKLGAAMVLQRTYRTRSYWAVARAYIELERRRKRERMRNWARRWQVSHVHARGALQGWRPTGESRAPWPSPRTTLLAPLSARPL